jgi:hypothetical protein
MTSPRAADVSSAREGREEDLTPGPAESRPSADRIARRAYERYEARGREDGHDQDDWFEAEREVNGNSDEAA